MIGNWVWHNHTLQPARPGRRCPENIFRAPARVATPAGATIPQRQHWPQLAGHRRHRCQFQAGGFLGTPSEPQAPRFLLELKGMAWPN